MDLHNKIVRIATAGSVDDGKSTLIGRLLYDTRSLFEDNISAVQNRSDTKGLDYSLFTDGLKSEREQKITIDVAYRYFTTPQSYFILADSPGHEQYTRNMVTAASTADAAILLIDAEKGILKQTRRHLFILTLLGIKKIAVAINKMDLVQYSSLVFQNIKSDFFNLQSSINHNSEFAFFPISAINGDNIVVRTNSMPWYTGPSLVEYLDCLSPEDANQNEFRFAVQQCQRHNSNHSSNLNSNLNSNFRFYLGQIASGQIKIGDEVTILPSLIKSKIKSLNTYSESITEAKSSQSISIEITDNIDIDRGDMLVQPNSLPHIGSNFEAMLVWFSDTKLDINKNYLIRHTTRWEKCNITTLRYGLNIEDFSEAPVASAFKNDIVRVRLQTFKPLFYDSYEKNRSTGSFILVDTETHQTLAAGMILDKLTESDLLRAPKSENANNVFKVHGQLYRGHREALLKQKAKIFWLTGLSASGKSTIAIEFERLLFQKNILAYRLDGDNLRHGLNKDLGFAAEDRCENVRRTAEVAKLFCDAGVVVIVSLISPFEVDRQMAKTICGEDHFIEVFVDASLNECKRRDPKGLYQKAISGQIAFFTGITSPYESPQKPDLHLPTEKLSAELAAAKLVHFYEKLIFKAAQNYSGSADLNC